RLDVAPFVVERCPAERRAHLVGLAPGIDRHAAVALPGRGIAIEAVMAIGLEHRVGQLGFLRFGFLYAGHVGILTGQPVEEALAGRGTDAVGVETDDAHVAPYPCASR